MNTPVVSVRLPVKAEWQQFFERYPLLGLIGNTPLLRLDGFSSLKVFLKCEWQNPGGSLKDRPVREMLLSAVLAGELPQGKTILDSSSGNAGIAYAMLGACLGFKVDIVIPENASQERLARLKAHGAQLHLTPALEGYDAAIKLAHKLHEKNPGRYFFADQYANDHNWRSHYSGTAEEILAQTDGKITHFLAGVGTGGSLTGIGRRLKEFNPKIQIIMIVPERFPGIEGLKPLGDPGDIMPKIFDESVVDRKIPINIEKAAQYCQNLAAKGIFVGQSTGAYLQAIDDLDREKEKGLVVTLGCDSGERYLSTRLWEK